MFCNLFNVALIYRMIVYKYLVFRHIIRNVTFDVMDLEMF